MPSNESVLRKGNSMNDLGITASQIHAFRGGLETMRHNICTARPQSEDATSTQAIWDRKDLCELDSAFKKAMTLIYKRAKEARNTMKNEWSGNPRLCDVSLLAPLGLSNKEVPLTRAIAWLIDPQGKLSLRSELLAALLRIILCSSVNASDVLGLSVKAEDRFESDDGHGRFDISIRGNIGLKKYDIAVEAKVNAPEGKRQLKRYEDELKRRADKSGSETCIVFLTRPGRLCKTLETAKCISYADILKEWIPILHEHLDSEAAPFARLLMADIARDLADMHIGDQLSGGHGLPRFVDDASMRATKASHNE